MCPFWIVEVSLCLISLSNILQLGFFIIIIVIIIIIIFPSKVTQYENSTGQTSREYSYSELRTQPRQTAGLPYTRT